MGRLDQAKCGRLPRTRGRKGEGEKSLPLPGFFFKARRGPASAWCADGRQNVPLLKASSVAAALTICCPSGLDAAAKHAGSLPLAPQALNTNASAAVMVEAIG